MGSGLAWFSVILVLSGVVKGDGIIGKMTCKKKIFVCGIPKNYSSSLSTLKIAGGLTFRLVIEFDLVAHSNASIEVEMVDNELHPSLPSGRNLTKDLTPLQNRGEKMMNTHAERAYSSRCRTTRRTSV